MLKEARTKRDCSFSEDRHTTKAQTRRQRQRHACRRALTHATSAQRPERQLWSTALQKTWPPLGLSIDHLHHSQRRLSNLSPAPSRGSESSWRCAQHWSPKKAMELSGAYRDCSLAALGRGPEGIHRDRRHPPCQRARPSRMRDEIGTGESSWRIGRISAKARHCGTGVEMRVCDPHELEDGILFPSQTTQLIDTERVASVTQRKRERVQQKTHDSICLIDDAQTRFRTQSASPHSPCLLATM